MHITYQCSNLGVEANKGLKLLLHVVAINWEFIFYLMPCPKRQKLVQGHKDNLH